MASTLDVRSDVITILDRNLNPGTNFGLLSRVSAGQGGAGHLMHYEATIIPSAAVAFPVYYPIVRVPSNFIVKAVEILSEANAAAGGTTFTGDITLFYSDNPLDGTDNPQGSGNLVNSLSGTNAFFAAAFAWGATANNGVITDVTFKNVANLATGGYAPSKAIQPLWQAAGLLVDPGGFFDISFLTTANNVAAAVKQTMRVRGVVAG